MSKEEFFAPVARTISNLKLRASYGVTGNQEIGMGCGLNLMTYLQLVKEEGLTDVSDFRMGS